eukprot:163809_1
MPLSISHSFNTCDDEKTICGNKEAIICVGSTGTGKSSLIGLFCGNNVIVGHGTASETTKSTLFKQRNSNDKYWLDSQGANDSSGTDDEKVLTDILRKLYDEKITKIKVVWCVSGDMCREKQEFKTQAAFIKSLGENVWQSCLIIQKKGNPTPRAMNGVLAAANRHGAGIQNADFDRLFGFRGLEAPYKTNSNDDHDEVLELLNLEQDLNKRRDRYKTYGYFANNEIIAQTSHKLSRLPSLGIQFSIKQCEKCGEKGDPRFVYAPCHSELEKHHPQSTVPYHTNSSVRCFHPGSIQKYHYGSCNTTHSYEWHHPGSLDNHVARNVVGHLLTFGIHTIARGASGTLASWTCCDRKEKAGGCRKRISSSTTTWSCCGWSSGSSGCSEKWGCCGSGRNSTGCRKEWGCCAAAESNPGCRRRYQCCGTDLGSIGCKDRCQSCHKAWGASKGCTKTNEKA